MILTLKYQIMKIKILNIRIDFQIYTLFYVPQPRNIVLFQMLLQMYIHTGK